MIVGAVIIILGVAALIVAISFTAVAGSGGKLKGQTIGQIVDISYYPQGFNRNSGREDTSSSFYSDNLHEHVAATVYAYEVNGIEYRRATGYMINDSAAKKKIGQQCTVRYNTADPSEASIAKGGTYKTAAIVLYIVAVLLVIVGVIVALLI